MIELKGVDKMKKNRRKNGKTCVFVKMYGGGGLVFEGSGDEERGKIE